MELGKFKFRLGLRTVKTGLAVMIIIILFLLLHRGNPMIACLAAVFAMRQDFGTTVNFGTRRVLANAIGGVFAMIYVFFVVQTHGAHWVEIIVAPGLLMMVIILNDGINNNKGIIGACAAYLMISMTVPADGEYLYAFSRVIDTFIGTIVAIIMNYGVEPTGVADEVRRDLAKLQAKENVNKK